MGGIVGGGIGASPKSIGFAKGAAKGAIELTPHTKYGVRLPESVVGAGVGGYIGSKVGLPKVGTAIGAAVPMVRGGIQGAASEPWLPRGLFDPKPAPPQNLLGAGPILTDPPVDGSFVRGVPAMAHPPNPARALPAAPRVLVTPSPEAVPDGSYVRGVNATPFQPRPRALLGPAPSAPIITEPPADTSFVRGVPAQYPVKEPIAAPAPPRRASRLPICRTCCRNPLNG
jgi:hypothetical protein